jgi:hypothetical protein
MVAEGFGIPFPRMQVGIVVSHRDCGEEKRVVSERSGVEYPVNPGGSRVGRSRVRGYMEIGVSVVWRVMKVVLCLKAFQSSANWEGGRRGLAVVESEASSIKLRSPQRKVAIPGSAAPIAWRRALLKAKSRKELERLAGAIQWSVDTKLNMASRGGGKSNLPPPIVLS